MKRWVRWLLVVAAVGALLQCTRGGGKAPRVLEVEVPPVVPAWAGPHLVWPLSVGADGSPVGQVVEKFGPTKARKISGVWQMHSGIDIRAPVGTAVVAMADGTVIDAGFNASSAEDGTGGYGWYLEIAHADGFGTLYAHLQQGTLVVKGRKVSQGERVGLLGGSGLRSGSFLHIELRMSGDPIDPMLALQGAGASK